MGYVEFSRQLTARNPANRRNKCLQNLRVRKNIGEDREVRCVTTRSAGWTEGPNYIQVPTCPSPIIVAGSLLNLSTLPTIPRLLPLNVRLTLPIGLNGYH